LNKVQREEDLAAMSGGLSFVRHFNSTPLPPFDAETVKGAWDYWRHTYMRRIVEPNVSGVLGVAWRENGQMNYYDQNGNAVANLNGGASTLQKTSSGWTLTQGNGDKEYYDSEGKLLSLAALSGATQTLTYSDTGTSADIAPHPGLLIAVTDRWGRQLQFGYDDASRLTWMIDPAGNLFQYLYGDEDENDKAGPLIQVVYPDQTTRSYLYEDPLWKYALTGIVDTDGKRLSTYAYNSNGEAVSTEQVGGVERYTITSTPSARTTTITNALGGKIVKQYIPVSGVYKPGSITDQITA